MVIDPVHGDLLFAIEGVFTLSGRGTVLAGQILSGLVRTGDHVAIIRDEQVVALADVSVDFICGRNLATGTLALLLQSLSGEPPRPGDRVVLAW